MQENKKRKVNNQSLPAGRQGGAAMLVSVVFFLFISLAIISGLVSPVVREFKNADNLIKSHQSLFLSESGVEDAYFRLKKAQALGSSTSLTLNNNTATTTIVDSGFNEKTIASLGDVSSRQRKSNIIITAGQGVSFSYGVQAGLGGFDMSNNAKVSGNVYANGNIIGTNGAIVTGTAISAGTTGTINGVTIGQNGTGNAQAHTVKNSNVAGAIYCQVGSGNNKSCNTSLPDPGPSLMPITEEMITKWKADAELGGTVSGNLTISTPTTLGPKKITGNLAINANLILTGTVYVMGRIITANGVEVSLSPSYGTTGGVLLTDGYVNLSNNVVFTGSGSVNSYIMLVTTSSCPTTGCTSINALEIANNVGAVILSAQNGTAHMGNNVDLNELVAKTIIMDNNAEVNYTSGLANLSFTSGPTGGWNVKTWKEIQ